jgi:hypothetical protein
MQHQPPNIVHVLDRDALSAVLAQVDSDSHLALFLTCKAFNTLRQEGGHLSTRVAVIYMKPTTLAWAIGIGCPPPERLKTTTAYTVLKMLGDREPRELTKHATNIFDMLKHPDAFVTFAAAVTLGRLEQSALAQISGSIANMLGDTDWNVRIAAATTLTKLEPARLIHHIRAIASVLRCPDWQLREWAVKTLRKIDQTALADHACFIADMLKPYEPDISETSPTSHTPFTWMDRDMHRKSVVCVLQTLRMLQPSVLALHTGAVAEVLRDSDWCVRFWAMTTLDMLTPDAIKEHAGTIGRMLQDSDTGVCALAIKLMGKMEADQTHCNYGHATHMLHL